MIIANIVKKIKENNFNKNSYSSENFFAIKNSIMKKINNNNTII